MNSTLVANWFGEAFQQLHPELQKLHLQGGSLYGDIEIDIGKGLAGIIGRRIANKLGIPDKPNCKMRVDISHDEHLLHWNRSFDDEQQMISQFKPVGNMSDGNWIEDTGPVSLHLSVEVKDGGWYWHCKTYKLHGITLPNFIFPKSIAYKRIENGQYRFYVGFSLPLIGKLFSYSGLLKLQT